MTAASLYDRAPRLALARDMRLILDRREHRRGIELDDAILDAKALVAHREMQLCRAWNTRSRRYMQKREAKLKSARDGLAGLLAERERISA